MRKRSSPRVRRPGRAIVMFVGVLGLSLFFLMGSIAESAAQLRDLDQGPGGPILVIADPGNPFTRYTAEILRAEGLNAFAVADIAAVDAQLLADHVIVILGELPLDAAQATLLADWVSGGGRLIAMRPDADLLPLLGLDSAAGTLSNAYLRIDTAESPGAGLVGETLQFHGTADLYTLAEGRALATLYADAGTATAHPAVTLRPVGALGGQAAAFTYDLPRSVVLTRQGNPAWFGMDRDGDGRVRSNDPFVGDTPGVDDWIDLDKVAIPQADEQQRLLANLILEMTANRLPLPRFWYFPSTADGEAVKAVVIMTMDDHGGAYTATRMNEHIAQSPPDCSLEDWECVRASAYMYTGNPMTDAQAAHYDSLGFEIALHIDTGCDSPWADYDALAAIYADQWPPFVAKYSSIPHPSSERGHCVTWADWASKPKLQALYGIRLDTTYYYEAVGPWAIDAHPGMYTGSGLPMRFADLDGTLIDVFQATTQMTDESGQSYPHTIDALLDKAVGPEGYYGAFTANMHSDNGPPWNGSIAAPQIVASAQARGVPVVSGRQMLTWLDGRGEAAFGDLAWNRSSLSFSVSRPAEARNLEGMLPTITGFGELTALRRDGAPVTLNRIETIKGVEYAIFSAESGAYEADYAADETPPVISGVQHVLDQSGNATISWTTDEPATSSVDYGQDPDALILSVTAGTLVLAHSLQLSGLAANGTYYYRVSSADAWANATTAPPLAQAPFSFNTPPPVCFADATAVDFAAGESAAGIYIAESGDGELILAPALGAEFSGTALPAGWSGVADPGGTFVVSGGVLTLDGARAQPTGFYAHPVGDEVRALDFVATFQPAQHQHAGFGITFQEYPYAIFSTTDSGGALYAHTRIDAGTGTTQLLSAAYLGAPHHYRIEWSATGATYFIDGAEVAQHAYAIATDLRPVFFERYLGGPTLTVDWVRMSPYSAVGSFDSRVYDADAPADWSIATWAGEEPVGTALAIAVRTGDTPIPDGDWSPFVLLPGSGTDIAGTSQFIQYQATLTSSDPGLTPALNDIAISCDAGEDTQPPFILALTASPDPDGTSAIVTWTTNESADSRVDYGSAPDALLLFESEGSLVIDHALTLTGLTPGETYYYRARSADALGNSATEPPLTEAPASFSTPAPPTPPCLVETTAADFEEGMPDAGITIGDRAGGELILAPTSGGEFGGSALAADWESGVREAGGLIEVSGGRLVLGAAWAGTAARLPAGRSVEFVATFTGEVQHAGFGEALGGPDFAIFTSDGSTLNARTFWGGGAGNTITPLGSGYLNAPHRYRIVWNGASTEYYIDDSPTPVATHAHAMTQSLRFIAMDSGGISNHFVLDWVRVTPYASTGNFESRIFDAGAVSDWVAASWEEALPAGSSLALSARTGDTATPDGNWTAYVALPYSGASIGVSSRYIQYRTQLATSDPENTPELQAITITCEPGEDLTPPAITALMAQPGADGTTAIISWSTDEAADSRVDYGLTSGSLNLTVNEGALVTAHELALSGLTPGATYYFRASSADAAANTATAPPLGETPASFTTPLAACAVDDLAADFATGTHASTWVAETGNGELILAPTSGGEFGGNTLAGDWESGLRAGDGIVQVSGGRLRLGAAWAGTLAYLPAGRSLEFVATFTNEVQHAGFATDLGGGDFAIFSSDGSTLNARSYWGNGAGNTITPLGSGYLNAPHRYRIVWNATSAAYYIDDSPTPIATHTHAMTLPLRFIAMDSSGPGGLFVLDWARVTPYATSGSFESRVFDGGEPVAWDAMSWTSTLPGGGSLALSVRTGDTPTPGAGWTAFTSVPSSGTSVDQIGRYLQYRAELGSSDPAHTPALESLGILCGTCLGAPSALTVLAAEQLRSENAPGETTGIRLHWPPATPGAAVSLYRKGFGNYPEYDDAPNAGAEPAPPASPEAALAAGWSLAATTEDTVVVDTPESRDYWYYVAFVTDACAHSSPVSNRAAALDYHLGDIAGGALPGQGDNHVLMADISVLGAAYGTTVADSAFVPAADVGPTQDWSATSRPLTDDQIQFEDLMVYALNYNSVGRVGTPPAPAAANALTLAIPDLPEPGGTLTVALDLAADGSLQGLSVPLVWNAAVLRPVGWAAGELLAAQGLPYLLLSPRPGQLDAALFGGGGKGIAGEGCLARIDFAVLALGDPGLGLGELGARGVGNVQVALEGAVSAQAPRLTRLFRNSPNPFNPKTTLFFELARAGRVQLRVFAVDGRLERTLADAHYAPGRYQLDWDGRDERGRRVGSGVYFVRLDAPDRSETQKMLLVK